jgi:two-component system, cell cycle response regulator
MLSLRNNRNDLLGGLFAGTDDYVTSGAASEEFLPPVAVGRRITYLDGSVRTSNREYLRSSGSDPLTGSHNLRFLVKNLQRELERSRRTDLPLAILSCDIDHFKRINDGLGYEAGDEVLRAFVARAGRCIDQRIDWIARSGGEEFVLVLPETNLKTACRVAERMHSALAAQPISTASGPLAVTVSTGIAALETVEELSAVSATELLRAAGCGQYASKHLGRDRTTVTSVGRGLVLSDALTGVILGAA